MVTPLRRMILSVDEWEDGRDVGATIDAPDEDTVREAILALDGARHTTAALHVMGREETCYLVVTRRGEAWSLTATLDGDLHHEAHAVTPDDAVRAAVYFLDFGRVDPTVAWQPVDE